MSYNFTFNGKHSLDDMGIFAELVAQPLFAEPKCIYEDIPGTDGEQSFTAANPKGRMCFKPRIIELECHFGSEAESREEYLQKATELARWLATDEDMILSFDSEPDIYYMAHAANLFNIENVTDYSGTFPVVFKCRPFKLAADEVTAQSFDSVTITNGGYYTDFVAEVTGTSAEGFTLISHTAQKQLIVNTPMDNATVVIDTGDMTAKMNGVSVLHECEGDFFELYPDDNTISITPDDGTVRFQLTYRPRYL